MTVTYTVISTDDPVRGRLDEKSRRTYARSFKVIASDVVSLIDAGNATGLPSIGSYFTHQGGTDLGAICVDKQVERESELATGGVVYKVTCEYKSRSADPDKNQENPLDRPADWAWSHITLDIAPLYDLLNKPYVNSVGDPLSTTPPRQDKLLVLRYGANRATYEPVTAYGYVNSVNAAAFLGFPKRSAKCTKWDGTEAYENGVAYWRHEFEFQFHPRLWIPTKVLDQGPRYRKVAGGTIVANDDDNGVATGTECLLAADGTRITKALLDAGTQPHYLGFTDYQEMSFSTLNIV